MILLSRPYLFLVLFTLVAGFPRATVASQEKEAAPPKPLRVLFVGNSQIYYNDLPRILEALAESAPKDRPRIRAEVAVAGGASLESHWKRGTGKGTPRSRINEEKWDYVILQEIYFAKPDTFTTHARLFHDLIRKSGARTVLLSTASVSQLYPKGFQELHAMHIALGKEMKVPVAAAGNAWLAFWGDNPTPEQRLALYDPDKAHPGKKGSYIYACTLYPILTGESPVGLTHRIPKQAENTITPAEAKQFQEAAWRVHREINGKRENGRGHALLPVSEEDGPSPAAANDLRVGAAAVEIKAEDSMPIGGSIHPGFVKGQEGKLRAVAVVIEKPGSGKMAVVACDVLFTPRGLLDPVVEEINKTCGIPAGNILINATHTHHAPSTGTVHGYQRDELFCRRLQRAIVEAVTQADTQSKNRPARFYFRLGEESSVGQNSRLLLGDGSIYWIGPRDDFVRPTGPFDPELPVLAFRDPKNKLEALIFNHSTHTIGTRKGAIRSPSFYGLAAQELEDELGGTVCFLEGASGSTHNLTLKTDEMVVRIKNAVKDALAQAEALPVNRIIGSKRKFTFRVRKFDEAEEEERVTKYCQKRAGKNADSFIKVFRDQRKVLTPQQGQERTTWLQVLLIGEVAIVGVPAEFFTKLGQDIKRRSPFRYTYVAELANDWIGYLPDRKGFELGGYQTWTGLHSYAEVGTGEAVVDEVVSMLRELKKSESRP